MNCVKDVMRDSSVEVRCLHFLEKIFVTAKKACKINQPWRRPLPTLILPDSFGTILDATLRSKDKTTNEQSREEVDTIFGHNLSNRTSMLMETVDGKLFLNFKID